MSVLEIQNLFFSYKAVPVLNNITLSLDAGDILTLLGPNGSGKTTLLNCIIQFLSNYEGKILLRGIDTREISRKDLSKDIAYVPQLGALAFDYTVKEFVVMGRSPHNNFFSMPGKKDYTIVQSKLEMLGIKHLIDRNMDELSGGEKQLVYIARALVQEPKVILLDEPTSALDYGNSIKVIQMINRLSSMGYTVVLTCHNPEYPLELNGKTAAIYRDGRFVFGETTKVVTSTSLSELYGVAIKICYLPEEGKYVCIHNE